jgi:formylglycine-generating enzyme required for sulfatase activity
LVQHRPRIEVIEPTLIVASQHDELDHMATKLGVTLQSFEFETVRVNEIGDVIERRKVVGRTFTEDLGDGVMLEMVGIPGGEFMMGSPDDEADREPDEGPIRRVEVSPFFVGRCLITQAQWRAVALWEPPVNARLDVDPSRFKGARRPVHQVHWYDIIEFCARLERVKGRTYRLCSEAEWEYAARAGTTTAFAFGPTISPVLANYNGRYVYDKGPTGTYRQATTNVDEIGAANAMGLLDVHGNLWEWVADPWHDDYRGAPLDGRAWESGGDLSRRVVRGGAWISHPPLCRSASRDDYLADDRRGNVGFRVACSVRAHP